MGPLLATSAAEIDPASWSARQGVPRIKHNVDVEPLAL